MKQKYTSDELVTSKTSVTLLYIVTCELFVDGLNEIEIVLVSTSASGISKIAFGFADSSCVNEYATNCPSLTSKFSKKYFVPLLVTDVSAITLKL